MPAQSLKVRILPRFPVSMEAGVGLVVSTTGGVVSLALDYAGMTPAEAPLDREGALLAILDSNGEYRKLTLDDLTDSLEANIPLITGTGAPSSEIGEDGWAYLDTVGKILYVKAGGMWGSGQSMVGTVLVWRGDWDSGRAYNVDDGVAHNGSSYIAVAASSATEPGVTADWANSWDVLAARATGDMEKAVYDPNDDGVIGISQGGTGAATAAAAFTAIKQNATTAATGVVELATTAETQAGSDTAKAVTPAGLDSRTATETRTGLIELATAAEVATGTDTARAVTPAGAAGTYSPIGRTINAQTGTSYIFVLADAGKLCTFANGSAVTVTVPPNSSVAFPIGTQIDVAALGAGQVTLAQGAGVTINSEDSKKKLTKQYSAATLVKTATDTWFLAGSLAT